MKKNKIIIRLVGGLGNQMFQYASAIGIAASHDRDLLMDLSSFEVYETWPYQLDCMNIPQDIYRGQVLGKPLPKTVTEKVLRKLGMKGHNLNEEVYQETQFHFNPNVMHLKEQQILLEGYFQSPLYFNNVESIIRERFALKGQFTTKAEQIKEIIAKATKPISIHVRRGDYLSSAASGVHGSLSLDYYFRSIELMKRLVGESATFFVFSDDKEYIKEAFSEVSNVFFVESDPVAPWEDMHLMAHCQHNIIANSSYSWWGAWLNSSKDKRVIAPAKWFSSEKLSSCNVLDLYPDDWILLK